MKNIFEEEKRPIHKGEKALVKELKSLGYKCEKESDWMFFGNDKEYDKKVSYVDGHYISGVLNDCLLEDHYKRWKIFIHPKVEKVPETLLKVLRGLRDLPVKGKFRRQVDIDSAHERIVLYVIPSVCSVGSYLKKIKKSLSLKYQRMVTEELVPCYYHDFILQPKPPFTKKVSPAVFIRQGERSCRDEVLEQGGHLSNYFKGESFHLLKVKRELERGGLLGNKIKEVCKDESDIQDQLNNM